MGQHWLMPRMMHYSTQTSVAQLAGCLPGIFRFQHQKGQYMITSSNGNIFRVTGPLCGEFTGDRWIPLTKASDAELRCFLWTAPKRLNKRSWSWWFETPSCSFGRHSNEHLLSGWYKTKQTHNIYINSSLFSIWQAMTLSQLTDNVTITYLLCQKVFLRNNSVIVTSSIKWYFINGKTPLYQHLTQADINHTTQSISICTKTSQQCILIIKDIKYFWYEKNISNQLTYLKPPISSEYFF